MMYQQPKQNDPELLKHKYILGINKSKTDKPYYVYQGFNDHEEVNQELRKEQPLYELITGSNAIKPYIDYDTKNIKDYIIKDDDDLYTLRTAGKKAILKELTNIYICGCRILGIHINVNDLLILDGCRPMTKDSVYYFKYSFHITANINYVFKTKIQCATFLLPALEQAEMEQYGNIKHFNNIDKCVYGMPTQRLRTIYSYKHLNDTDTLKPINHEGKVLKVNEPHLYLVQYFKNEHIYINCPFIEKGITETKEAIINKITKKQNIYTNDILKLLLRYGLKTPSIPNITETNGRTYYNILYNANIDKCPYGNDHDRPKRHISICYAYIYNGSCFVGCHGEKCKDKKHINMGFILNKSPLCDRKNAYQVNERYLTQNKDNKVNQLCEEFIQNDNYKALVIKSETGTGKTYLLKEYITRYEKKLKRQIRILLISTRQSYARSMCGNSLKDLDITNYLDYKKDKTKDKNKLYEVNRLCLSMEGLNSLMMGAWCPYDIVILDESETISRHLYSPTVRNGSYDVFLKLRKLIQYSKKCILLDADAGIPTMTLINNIDTNQIIKINNTYEKQKKQYYMTKDRKEFINDIKTDIIFDRKAYIVCLSKSEATYIYNELQPMMNNFNKKHTLITGDSDDLIKRSLSNVNDEWIKYDYVITTSTTGAGVDFNIKDHFNNIYGYVSCGSSCPVEFIQILDRVRHPTSNNVKILIHSNVSIPDDNTFICTVDNSRYILEDRQLNTIICNAVNRTIYDESTNMIHEQMIYVDKDQDYTTLTYHNHTNTVLNSSPSNYILVLKLLLEQRGHMVVIDPMKHKQERHNILRHEKYKGIKTANKQMNEVEDLLFSDNKTYEQCRILDKTALCNRLGIHTSNRDNEEVNQLIDIYETPTKKSKTHRILKTHIKEEHADIIKHYLKIDERVFNEDSDRVNQNIMNLYARLINIINYDYTDNFHISVDDMKTYINELKTTKTELRSLETRADLCPLKIMKKLLCKYGLIMEDERKSIRNEEGKPRKITTGYVIKQDKDIYKCVYLIHKKLDKVHFSDNLNKICLLHNGFETLTINNTKLHRIV